MNNEQVNCERRRRGSNPIPLLQERTRLLESADEVIQRAARDRGGRGLTEDEQRHIRDALQRADELEREAAEMMAQARADVAAGVGNVKSSNSWVTS
jgi:hypothetical protein